jgi:hypothetical protein
LNRQEEAGVRAGLFSWRQTSGCALRTKVDAGSGAPGSLRDVIRRRQIPSSCVLHSTLRVQNVKIVGALHVFAQTVCGAKGLSQNFCLTARGSASKASLRRKDKGTTVMKARISKLNMPLVIIRRIV